MHYNGNYYSKLPTSGTTIFSTMSALANQHNAINLSQGFPNFDCHPQLKALVSRFIDSGKNQYAPMIGLEALREEIAKKVEKQYDCIYHPEKEITIVAGATQGLHLAISTFINENDEVLVFQPSYDAYTPCILMNKGVAVYYTLDAPDFKIEWSQVGKLINQRTKMIIINTPHNPTGTVLNEHDLLQLEKLVQDKDIIVLSDEVYEHVIFDGLENQSVAKFPSLREQSIIVSSFGKTFHTTGWKVGYVLAPENLTNEFRKVFQFAMFSVSTPFQYAIAEFLKMPEHYLGLSNFYQQKRDLFASFLRQSRFKVLPVHGTYFQCVEYSEISDKKDMEFTKELIQKHKVAAIPLSPFYQRDNDAHLLRFCFAKTDETLQKAGEILCKI